MIASPRSQLCHSRRGGDIRTSCRTVSLTRGRLGRLAWCSWPVLTSLGLGNSPWWFSSDLSGRFDLTAPDGTCYLATDLTSALRERFGHALVRQGMVTFEAAARTVVSTLRAPDARWLANICSPRAAEFRGMTREIGTCPSYRLPQAWSAAFFSTGPARRNSIPNAVQHLSRGERRCLVRRCGTA